MKARPILTTCTALAMTLGLLGVDGSQRAAQAQSPDRSAAPSAADGNRREARQPNAGARAERRSGNRNERRNRGSSSLTENQVEEAVALMIELDPSMAPKVEELRSERPELLRRAVTRRFPRIGHMLKLKESRPALYELRVSDIRLETLSHQQARALAALPEGDPAADAARAQLRDTLEQHFAVRQEVRRAEIEMLREQLAKMEAKRVDEKTRRDELVDKRLAQLEAKPPPDASDSERLRGRRDRDQNNRRDGDRRDRERRCLLYTSPSPRDLSTSRMPSSA